ncbi:MAG: Bax inhibitor-1/YccA family protein [Nocardioidaceae bacterium]|nr:Bax inhibitor-1/YccA family protein [Nocardioidaceae bacterium]
MQSTNPVFARNDSFNGRGGNAYGTTTYPGGGASSGYGDPSTWSTGTPGQDTTSHDDQRMTIDSVVQKSAITLGVLILAAAATWIYLGDVSEDNIATFGGLAMGGALIGFVLAMVNSFKRIISPALVLAYAAAEGVFVGAFSSLLDQQFPGIVISAVAGTVMAFAGTLTAYKVLNLQVTDKFRRGVMAAVLGMVGVMVLDLVMGLFGFDFLNLNSGFTGLAFSALGVVLGVFMLILDFDFVEQGIASGAPEKESWRAAFGLTVTLIWLYVMMLRLLAILRGE